MATIVIPKLGIIRENVPLDNLTHVGPAAEMTRITFGEDQHDTRSSETEAGQLPAQVVQCSTSHVFIWGSVDEWDKFVTTAQEKAAEAMAKRQAQAQAVQQQAQASGLVIPQIGIPTR